MAGKLDFDFFSRSQTPIRLPYGPNNPPTPHEVAFAQKLLNRIEDMKGKFLSSNRILNQIEIDLKVMNLHFVYI